MPNNEHTNEEEEGQAATEAANVAVVSAPGALRSDDIILTIASSTWQYIPTDVITLIARHLDGRSLARFSSCDRVSNGVVQQRVDLWRHLVSNTGSMKWQSEWMTETIKRKIDDGLETAGFERYKPGFDPRRYYAARYRATIRERQLASSQYRQEMLVANGAPRIIEARWVEEVAMPVLIILLFLIFIGILISELQSSREVTYRSLWPLLAILSIFFLVFVHLFYIRWRNSVLCCCCTSSASVDPLRRGLYIDTSSRLVADSYWRNSKSRVRQLIRLIEGDSSRDDWLNQEDTLFIHISIFLIFLGITAWIVLITLKVTDNISSSWSIVWLPLYLSFGLFTFGVLFLHWFEEDSVFQHSVWESSIRPILVMLPVLLMVILVHLYLVGSISRLQYALMPLTIMHGILFLMAFFSICLGGGTDYSAPIWMVAIPGWIVIPAPFLLFQIFLMLKVDGDWTSISWVGVFAPLFAPLAALLIGVIVMSRNHHSDIVLDANRRAASGPASRPPMLFDMPRI